MPKQILLVEDELILCENYAKTIREHGYEVITCHSKQGALQIINKHLPDLAILDIGLGDEMEAGFDLCREIRSLSAVLPIIFLTARGMGRHKNSVNSAYQSFYDLTRSQLGVWGAKHHQLFLGKPSGDYYIDDKGVNDEDFFNTRD